MGYKVFTYLIQYRDENYLLRQLFSFMQFKVFL